ncbi:competence/damage-inducible protein A [Lentibacillus halophilus]|uniref:Putative competence-damage inducible protein n=1 Tax=Lentibacillus halophilus TaxID=295065 RepID=A0ABP3JBB4_9BACI
MTTISTEIIAVGTELLLGQIADTNAQWISKKLASIGINVHHHAVVGDNRHRVEEQFRVSNKRSDVIIVTGGLGPTEDDLTREAFQQVSGKELTEHEPSMEMIKSYYDKKGMKMTPNNRKQARVFVESDVFENHTGMAPGMIVPFENTTWIFLPGVPNEMKRMMTDHVLPHLQRLTGEDRIIKSVMLRFIGIGESRIEHDIQDLIDQQENPTIAPLAQSEGVAIRLTAKAETDDAALTLIEQSKRAILNRVGDHYFGMDEQSLEEQVLERLKEQGKTVAAAESLTGGMFTDRLIAIPGASDACRGGIVCYDTTVKEHVLGVESRLLNEHGTVSEECARAMADNVSSRLDADIGISFTGVAGPDRSEGHPAGTVFIALSADRSGKIPVEKHVFYGDRNAIREQAVLKGYELLYHLLK